MEKLRLYAGRNSRQLTQTEESTLRQIVVGNEEYTFVVEIDEKSLIAMGGRAARNKNGRAQRGGMVAKITSRRAF